MGRDPALCVNALGGLLNAPAPAVRHSVRRRLGLAFVGRAAGRASIPV